MPHAPRFEITDSVTHHSGETGQVADILEPDAQHPGYRYLVVRGPSDRGVTWPERALSEGEGHTPNRALNRAQLETIAWQVTPEDYRGGSGSRRTVLWNTPDGTTLMPLGNLTDNQIRKYIGPAALESGGDMRKNGSSQKPKFRPGDEVTDTEGNMEGTVMYVTESGPFDDSPYRCLVQETSNGRYRERPWSENQLKLLRGGPGSFDMRPNGEPMDRVGNFMRQLDAMLRISDRWTPQYRPTRKRVFINFYNIPEKLQTDQAVAENNRIMLDVTGFEDSDKLRVELAVRGPSFGDARFKLRAKSGSDAVIAKYCADYINLCSQKAPYGFAFDNYEKNARSGAKFKVGDQVEDHTARGVSGVVRSVEPVPASNHFMHGKFQYEVKLDDGPVRTFRESVLTKIPAGHGGFAQNGARTEADETAARELSLYIENEYDLVGAPNSQGKAIEKNLLQKIRKGSFDLARSEDAWMGLMETGAKKYAKEFASPKDWSVMFNKATRELVAHEFATTFYEEHKGSR